MITRSEYMRRMKEMSQIGGGFSFYGELPDSYSLVVNCNHPLIEKISSDAEKERSSTLEEYSAGNKLVRQLIDLALLANNMLKGEDLSRFVKRSVELL